MKVSQEVLTVLIFLMPGLMASLILNILLVRKEFDTFTKIVEALVFSFIIYATASPFVYELPLRLRAHTEGGATSYRLALAPTPLIIDMSLAIVLPVLLAISVNKDLHMRALRFLGATMLKGKNNTWHEVFTSHQSYVTVTLSDGNRIFGWPEHASRDPDEGLIYLQDPAWIKPDSSYESLNARGILLVKKDLIESVIFSHTTVENVAERIDSRNHDPEGEHDGEDE
jgi:hypothetical protein